MKDKKQFFAGLTLAFSFGCVQAQAPIPAPSNKEPKQENLIQEARQVEGEIALALPRVWGSTLTLSNIIKNAGPTQKACDSLTEAFDLTVKIEKQARAVGDILVKLGDRTPKNQKEIAEGLETSTQLLQDYISRSNAACERVSPSRI